MGRNFYFKEFEVLNFRLFKRIKLEKIKRINIISGVNGSGKTALIESIFLSLDLNNPTALIRPFQWRGMPLGGDDLKSLFPNKDQPGKLSARTINESFDIDLNYGPPAPDMVTSASQSIDPSARSLLSQLTAPNAKGVSITAKKSNSTDLQRWFISQNGDNINATAIGIGNQTSIPGTYLSPFVPLAPQESADRVSQLIKQGRKSEIISYMQLVSPGIDDIAVFQDRFVAQIYVSMAGGSFQPIALMGAGLRALSDIVICTMASKNGVVFIDELDSALHFSVVPNLWNAISKIASAEEAQIFAITHSRETLSSAAAGIRSAGNEKDFQYIRVDYVDPDHRCVCYDLDELENALELQVEIR